jgi:2'-5' RNA ligase
VARRKETSSHVRDLTFPHATVFLDRSVAAAIEVLRDRWDPVMASQISAHVTVTYPAEVASLDDLMQRVGAAAEKVGRFRLQLGKVRCFDRPEDGVFVEVADLDGGWRALRKAICSSAGQLDVKPHVTVVHPRTSDQGSSAWERLSGQRFDGEMTAAEISVTAFDGRRWFTVATFALHGEPIPHRGVGVSAGGTGDHFT